MDYCRQTANAVSSLGCGAEVVFTAVTAHARPFWNGALCVTVNFCGDALIRNPPPVANMPAGHSATTS
ncbi:hypothetical protein [Methylobacterium sp. B1]|uniref:hypothetical protein n=1 Tax=Methylobacterium sp. B1 TaxID=91459 RepID=UPI0016511693|nr:hypothetical protein [Methylobacterium sp. B1]